MGELTWQQAVLGHSAGSRHRSLLVVVTNRLMAPGAHRVRILCWRLSRGEGRGRCRIEKKRQQQSRNEPIEE
jgi:hypothetical protein